MPSQAMSELAPAEIIAYVFPRDRPIQPDEIAAAQLTRINYAFSIIKEGRMVEGSPTDAANFAALEQLKQRNPALKVLVSVGGWLGSGNFSDMALTPASRSLFIQSVVEFLQRYHLDGLDIDWEYPGLVGAGNRFRPEDGANFTSLLRELRERFDRERTPPQGRWLLSVAAGASDQYLAHTEMGIDQRYLDDINLMTYDFYEPSDHGITGNHAALFTDPRDPRGQSADASVRAFERSGVPARKLVLGVPFYGHLWGKVPPATHGLFQPGSPVPDTDASYATITGGMIGHGFVRYWDQASAVPFLYSESQHQFVSYEDPVSLARKCAYVRQQGLAGVMFWEYFGDPSGVLLKAVHEGLQQPSSAPSR